uniref:Transmembrane protein n=1 Tax=Panagrolaimus davidi TaxID=227884 RepID=A0A914QZ85_9BILA
MATFDMKTTMNPRNSIVEMEDHRDSIGGDTKFLQDRPSHLLGFSQKYSPLLLVLLGTARIRAERREFGFPLDTTQIFLVVLVFCFIIGFFVLWLNSTVMSLG